MAVVVNGDRPLGSPARERRPSDARLPAGGEAESGSEEDEASHLGGSPRRRERCQVAAEARAEEERWPPCQNLLDDGEHAAHGHVREVGREVGDLERDPERGEARAEVLRLRAPRTRGEPVQIDERRQ